MNWIEIFNFPKVCNVEMNMPKKQFLLQPDITLSESRLLRGTGVRSILNFANVSSAQGNVPTVENEKVSFQGIMFIQVTIEENTFQKMAEPVSQLIHKLIPHHCVVVVQSESGDKNALSLAKKRISKNSPDLRVVEKSYFVTDFKENDTEFLKSLTFEKSEKLNQKLYYEYLIRSVIAFENVELTNTYYIRSFETSEALLKLKKEIAATENELATLRKKLTKDTQMAEKVEINTKAHQLMQKIKNLREEVLEVINKEN